MNDSRILTAADALARAQETRTPCAPVSAAIGALGVAGAYTVQEELTQRAVRSGRRIVGRKIGITSTAVQKQLGVDSPDFGALFADMAFTDNDEIPLSRLIQPRLEGEIAFVLDRDINAEKPCLSDVISAIGYALPAIEIVDSRVRDWKINIVDTIADNASSGLFVLGGSPKRIGDIDLRLCGMTLERRGEPVSLGCGAACLGNPLYAVLWLAQTLAAQQTPLRAGDIILSGALGPMVSAVGSQVYEARIEGLGRVSATLSETPV